MNTPKRVPIVEDDADIAELRRILAVRGRVDRPVDAGAAVETQGDVPA